MAKQFLNMPNLADLAFKKNELSAWLSLSVKNKMRKRLEYFLSILYFVEIYL